MSITNILLAGWLTGFLALMAVRAYKVETLASIRERANFPFVQLLVRSLLWPVCFGQFVWSAIRFIRQ